MNSFKPYAAMPFYPGPVSVHPDVARALSRDYAPPRIGTEYLELYKSVRVRLQKVLGTKEDVLMGTGEGMLVLWGALKSLLKPGDTVLTVGTGVFGDGFADMAEVIGLQGRAYFRALRQDHFRFHAGKGEGRRQGASSGAHDRRSLRDAFRHAESAGRARPSEKGISAFPSWWWTPWPARAARPYTPTPGNADCVLGGSQKCLACPPDMSFMSVSEAAWERVREVNYTGYDAIRPFDHAIEDPMRFPYTPNWWGVAALDASLSALEKEGLEKRVRPS